MVLREFLILNTSLRGKGQTLTIDALIGMLPRLVADFKNILDYLDNDPLSFGEYGNMNNDCNNMDFFIELQKLSPLTFVQKERLVASFNALEFGEISSVSDMSGNLQDVLREKCTAIVANKEIMESICEWWDIFVDTQSSVDSAITGLVDNVKGSSSNAELSSALDNLKTFAQHATESIPDSIAPNSLKQACLEVCELFARSNPHIYKHR